MPPRPPPAPGSKPQSPLRIAHDGEFYARLLSREASLVAVGNGNPSFRYYGAGPGAVPIVWESQPGKPKDAHSSRMLAAAAAASAITPPPSYHLAGPRGGHGKAGRGRAKHKHCGYKLKQWVKIGFVAAVFRRLALGCGSRSSTASTSSSSSTRWLFPGSNVVADPRDQDDHCYVAAPAFAVGPSTWMLQFCSGGRRQPGRVYGWRP